MLILQPISMPTPKGRRYSTDMAYYGIIIDILCIRLYRTAGSDEVRT